MPGIDLLAAELEEAGLAVAKLEAVTSSFSVAGVAALRGGDRVFAKTDEDADADLFKVEAAGLMALRELGGVRVPDVVHVSPRLLVLEALRPRGDGEQFWEQLGLMVAALHASTVSDRFGWHRDGWHGPGRLRQDNSWETDGHAFYAQRRILRWLPEPLVEAEFDRDERRAVERLCAALPELIPPHPASLTHGDLWIGNILADDSGRPALIDQAVSYTWPEIDLAELWVQRRPPDADRFFAAYEELARPFAGWQDQAQLLRIWDLFSVIAHGTDTWGAAEIVRKLVAPFLCHSGQFLGEQDALKRRHRRTDAMTDGPTRAPKGVDLERPNAARIYDALLGGSHNWAIDRLFAAEVNRNFPLFKTICLANREFLGRAVQHCARQGITQFLDIGSGVPTAGNVHEIADEVNKDSRCVYVDFEPVAAAHCRFVLEQHGDPQRHAVIEDNLLNVDQVWEAALATGVLDPNQPIGLIMVAVLHFVLPGHGAHAAVDRYRELLPPGSHLVISHGSATGIPDDVASKMARLEVQYSSSSTPAHRRTAEEITAFFGDFDLLEPGLVWLPQWHLDERESPACAEFVDTPERACVLGGVARKPQVSSV